jgi:hypothetical protein
MGLVLLFPAGLFLLYVILSLVSASMTHPVAAAPEKPVAPPAVVTDPPEGTPRYADRLAPFGVPKSGGSTDLDGQMRDLNHINESNLKALKDMNNGDMSGAVDHLLDSTHQLDDYYRTYGK